MKRLLASLAVATLALVPITFVGRHATAAGFTPYTYRDVCSANVAPGTLRCYSIQRLGGWPVDPSSPAFPSGFHPADLQSAYNVAAAAGSQGGGQIVADVLWHDDPNLEADLNVYRQQFGLGPCTTANGCFKKVNQNGQPSPLPAPDPGVAPEWALDVEMFSAICPKCKILVVEANQPQDSSIGPAENEAVKLGATEISNSYGENESSSSATFNKNYNHPGVAITVSSGDSGYAFGPSFPASSQYVTSVGGTSLYKTSRVPRGWYETAWNGAGSGCSGFATKPSWQHDTGCARRTIADVSAIADPNTGIAVYDSYGSGGWSVYGGTSVASPIIAAVYALAGNASSVTYGSYPYGHTSSLNDVTRGNNGTCRAAVHYICTAGPGYDGPTGLGTPNGTGGF